MITLVGQQRDCKMNDLDWPWVAICRQNPFLASTLLQKRCVFWSPLHKFEWRIEDRPIQPVTKMYANHSSFRKYKAYGGIRGGSSWRGRQMRVGLSTTAIFGHLNGYFFGIFRDKACNIIWRHSFFAVICRPTRVSISSYNIAGLISEDSEEVSFKWPKIAVVDHPNLIWRPRQEEPPRISP